MRTQFSKKTDGGHKWYLVDADGKVLGRLAAKVAEYLRGKNKPQFTPNADVGDFIVVVNAEKIKVTGKKLDTKTYYSHSGYSGGLKAETLRLRLQRKPEQVITDAVWGMLPKGRLGSAMIRKLKVYRGKEHPHSAQKPETLNI